MKLETRGGYEFKNGVLRKSVSKKKHLLRIYDGFGVQLDILQDVPDETKIEIYERDDKKTYKATKHDFWTKGTVVEFANHGPQVVLSRSNFEVV